MLNSDRIEEENSTETKSNNYSSFAKHQKVHSKSQSNIHLNQCCIDFNSLKRKIYTSKLESDQDFKANSFPRSNCEMNLPKPTTLDITDSDQADKPKLRIIKVKKKKNAGDLELSEMKKKKLNSWKNKKDNLKRMINFDLLKKDKKIRPTVYDQERIVPRELHELHTDNLDTDDELFLKIESGSVSTINSMNTEASSKSKFEDKLKNTKDKYMKYQTKALNKLKSFIPKTRSSENLKFMTASDISKSRTLVAEDKNRIKNPNHQIKNKPPRPPPPKLSDNNFLKFNKPVVQQSKNLRLVNIENLVAPTINRPPIKPARRKSKRSNCSSVAGSNSNLQPASVFYKQLREKWLEKHGSKSNLDSICSTKSIPNYLDRKSSYPSSNIQSLIGDNFRYRLRADFQSNQQLNSQALEKQSIKSEPTYAIANGLSGLPPKAPLRKRLTVSSYLSGSNLSLHRKLNPSYFSSRTGLDKTEQATDALFWKPFSYKTGRVRSLTELYIRKNQSPQNSNPDHLQNKLNEIYCMPKRPPLPVRYKKRQLNIDKNKTNESSLNKSFREAFTEPFSVYQQQSNQLNYLKPVQYTNQEEVYTVRDASVGPASSSINYGEKEIQTSLEDFHDLDYENELDYHQIFKENSPRYIDSSTNDEFDSLAKTRNLSDNDQDDKKIRRQLEKSLENDNVLDDFDENIDDKEEATEFEFEKEIKIVEFNVEQPKKVQIVEYNEREENRSEMKSDLKEDLTNMENDLEENLEENLERNLEKSSERNLEEIEENTLNDTYVTVKENTLTSKNTSSTSSKTIGPYLDANQDNTLTDDKSNYLTLENYDLDIDKKEYDTDTLADLGSLASLTGYETPMQNNGGNSSNRSSIIKPKRTKRKNQLRNSGLDTEDDEDELTDEIIGIAANLQKELKQLVEKEETRN